MNIDLQQIENQGLPNFAFGGGTLAQVIDKILPYLFGAAGLLLLLYLIWGGFGYMMSGGDPKAVDSAKKRITTALIGFVIIFTAFWLVQLLGLVLGIPQFRQVFG